MTGTRTFNHRDEPDGAGPGPRPDPDAAAVMAAVREDIRQTLRVGWLDPAREAAAGFPVFFTAAWSAVRPNVGKSFLMLARAVRAQTEDGVRATLDPPDARKQLEALLSEEELRRVEESARAAHLAAAKAQLVVLALHRAAQRERMPGTGREEPPIRRGVPDWQRWMTLQTPPDAARAMLDEATTLLGVPAAPTPLRLFSRWPAALDVIWNSLRKVVVTPEWQAAATGVRRVALSGISSLPHAVDLQWAALKARGFTEDERQRLVALLSSHDATMAAQTLMAGYAWAALGGPDIGVEG